MANKLLSGVVLALCIGSSAKAQSLGYIAVFAPPVIGEYFSYMSQLNCNVPHIYLIDQFDEVSDFQIFPLPEGTHTFRFVTTTFFGPEGSPRLYLSFSPCCGSADLSIAPGETATRTIGATTYTATGFVTHLPTGMDKVSACTRNPDGSPDWVSEFTLTVSTSNDSDNDGVLEADDDCPGTSEGATVDAGGCSVPQLCTLAAGNHGQYVSCIARKSRSFADAGLLTEEQRAALVTEAAQSSIGK